MEINGTLLEHGSCYAFYRPATEAKIYEQLAGVSDYRAFLKCHPRDVVPKFGLRPEYVRWITTVTEDPNHEYETIHPSDVAKIEMVLRENASHLKPGLRHIHFGTGTTNYLITNNNDAGLIKRFIAGISDKVMADDAVLTLDLRPGCFNEIDYAKFMSCVQLTELDRGEKPNPIKKIRERPEFG